MTVINSRMLKSREFDRIFADLYENHWESLFRLAVRIIGDEDDAADIVQETFVNFWKLHNRLDQIQSLKDYLFIMTRNLSIRHVKKLLKQKKKMDFYLDRITAEDRSTEQVIDTRSLAVRIDNEVAKLPKKMQKVFVLSRNGGLSHKEIGEELSISEKTVKKQISNSLKILNIKLLSEKLFS